MARATAATTNPTALTLASARSRAMVMTDTTAVWINMLVRRPTATRRLTATRRSTASPPSMALTTNMTSMIPMAQSRAMELIRAMVTALVTVSMALDTVMAHTAIKILLTASTANPMEANPVTERSRATVMIKDTGVIGDKEHLTSTLRRKVTAAKKATEAKLDMALVTITAQSKAMDTTSLTVLTQRMARRALPPTVDTAATAAMVNPTALTLASARSRTTDMTNTTVAWISMAARSPMATRRNTATRRSTARAPSTPSTTNMPKKITMVRTGPMVLTRAMAINTLKDLMATMVTVMALTAIKISTTASTLNPMAANQATERNKVTVMIKAMATTRAMERLMNTWKKKVTAPKRATAIKKDMELAKTMAKRRVTDMSRATNLKILTVATRRLKAGPKEKYIVSISMLMVFMMTKNRPTVVTLATARNKTTDMTRATAVRIDMLVERLTATRRPTATRRSTASPPSLA